MNRCGYKDDATGGNPVLFRLLCRDEEMRECNFQGIVGAQDVNIDDRLHGIGAE